MLALPVFAQDVAGMTKDAWLQRMRGKMPAFACAQSPQMRQCMKVDWPECIEIMTPAVERCIYDRAPDIKDGPIDQDAMRKHGVAIITCAVSIAFDAVNPKGRRDGSCTNVVNMAEIVDPNIQVTILQDGVIRVPNKSGVRLSKSPFVVYVSSSKGIPGIFATRQETAFQSVIWSNPQFLAPVVKQVCPVNVLCLEDSSLQVFDVPSFLANMRQYLGAKEIGELERLNATYENLAQIILAKLNVANFKKVGGVASYEFQVNKLEPEFAKEKNGEDRFWLVVVMNDEPQKSFPYIRLRPIQIQFE